MKYEILRSSRFKRDYKRIKSRGKNLEKLRFVIQELADGKKLDPRFSDHQLYGEFSGCRECHIEPDWLLVYEIIDNQLALILTATGTHTDLY
ncbi:MAG: type II toxin-antitoxin system YafQ family toxin [Anaerovoracaceae bacterium]